MLFRHTRDMRVIEHSFSHLLREPKSVVKDLDDGDVLLRRRGAPPLRLTRVDRDDHRAEAYATTGHTLRNLAMRAPDALGTALLDEFHWTSFLPETDRVAFVDEFTRTVVAAADLDYFSPLTAPEEWRTTVEIHADSRLLRRLRRSSAHGGERVPCPGA